MRHCRDGFETHLCSFFLCKNLFFIPIKCCIFAVQNYKYEIQSYTSSSSSPVNTGQMQYVYMKIDSGFAILQTLFFYIIEMHKMNKLKIAIQKEGRLSEKSLELIEESGVRHNQDSKRKLISLGENFPIEILYLRDDDIPQYVADGVADIGIVGENEVMEKNRKVEIVERLGFAKCRLSLAIPQSDDYNGADLFQQQTDCHLLSPHFNQVA